MVKVGAEGHVNKVFWSISFANGIFTCITGEKPIFSFAEHVKYLYTSNEGSCGLSVGGLRIYTKFCKLVQFDSLT